MRTKRGKIVEVQIGGGGGERLASRTTFTVGGETRQPFHFEDSTPNRPVIAANIFDIKVQLPPAITKCLPEVIEDPVAWAKLAVEKFKADMIKINLVSIYPLGENKPPSRAIATVEKLLQTINVPLIIGGCGDCKKDSLVFQKIAEITEGEGIVFSPITGEMSDHEIQDLSKIIKKHEHVVVAQTPSDLNQARILNRRLYDTLPRDKIIMDLQSHTLSQGFEYSYTIYERARLAGLAGDPELQHPLYSSSVNAWAAPEAWLDIGEKWEPSESRGILWEIITALSFML